MKSVKSAAYRFLTLLIIFTTFAQIGKCSYEPLLVSMYVVNGESTPSFGEFDARNTTKANYVRGPNQITNVGLDTMQDAGENIWKFLADERWILPEYYSPRDIFIRGLNDNKYILSAYAFLIGMYPFSVNGIKFKDDLKDSEEDVTDRQITQVRNILGVRDKLCNDKKMIYNGGNKDFEFLTSATEQFPKIKYRMLKNLNEAKIVFEREYGNQLYQSLSDFIGVDFKFIDFFNTIDYLEDYVTAKFNNKKTKYEFPDSVKKLIKIYYQHYYKNGLFLDQAWNRVLTHNYFRNLVKEFISKTESDQDNKFTKFNDQIIDTLSLSLQFGNHLTLMAILHQLNEIKEYYPSFGDTLKWVLFYRAGKYWVRAYLNDELIKLEGHVDSNGEILLDDFINYICGKVYHGNFAYAVNDVEDPNKFLTKPSNCKEALNKINTMEEDILEKKINMSLSPDDTNSLHITAHCSFNKENDTGDSDDTVYVITHPVIYTNDKIPEVNGGYYRGSYPNYSGSYAAQPRYQAQTRPTSQSSVTIKPNRR